MEFRARRSRIHKEGISLVYGGILLPIVAKSLSLDMFPAVNLKTITQAEEIPPCSVTSPKPPSSEDRNDAVLIVA